MHERFPQNTAEPEAHQIPGDVSEALNSEVFPAKKRSHVTVTETAVFADTPGDTQTNFFAFEQDGGFSFIGKSKQLALDQVSGGGPEELAGSPKVSATAAESITETLMSEVTEPQVTEERSREKNRS